MTQSSLLEEAKTQANAAANGPWIPREDGGPFGLTPERLELLKRTIAKGTTDDEFQLFLHVCRARKVDPFSKLIYPVKRWDSKLRQEVMQLQSSIDSFRLQAERTGKYAGQLGPQWCGADGAWRDVWLEKAPPAAARVGVLRHDFKEPLWTVALWTSYVQTKNDGTITSFWAKMGPLMLAKCAEALSLRRAFPEDLAGLYTSDEMAQAENELRETKATPAPPRSLEALVEQQAIIRTDREPTPAEVSQAVEGAKRPPKAKPPQETRPTAKDDWTNYCVEPDATPPAKAFPRSVEDLIPVVHGVAEVTLQLDARNAAHKATCEKLRVPFVPLGPEVPPHQDAARITAETSAQIEKDQAKRKAKAAAKANVDAVFSKTWEAAPGHKPFELEIPVCQNLWNLWCDTAVPEGPLTAKGAKTWRDVSRKTSDGYHAKMLLAAIDFAKATPEEAMEYHERCACTLAVLEWWARGNPSKTKVTTEPEPK